MNNVLEVKGLTKKFTPTAGVKGVSLALGEGRVLAYLGHNGAGKTTTIRALLGLLKADAGEIRYFGAACDTASPEFDRTRKDIGVCLDSPGFYPELSAWQNLELFAGLYGLGGAEFKRRAGLLLERLGLAAAAGNRVKTFSKGMTQKLALARALQHKPRLLFLDEPMSGLDPEARILVRDYLAEISEKKGISVFLTSHDLNEVEQIAHEVVILEKGAVKLSGGLAKLKEAFSRNAAYVLMTETESGDAAASVVAAALGAVKYSRSGRELRLECGRELSLEGAAAACAKAGLKLSEFRKERATLEEIYFESLSKHENRN